MNMNMITEPYNIFWNSKKYIYEPDETNTQNCFNGLNYERENNYWVYKNDYEKCITDYDDSTDDDSTDETTQNNDIQIWVTPNNIYVTTDNDPALETIIDDIETGGHDDNETICDIVNEYNYNISIWSSYFMSAISTVNNFILGITENFSEKGKDE